MFETNLQESEVEDSLMKNCMEDIHKIIDSQVRNSLIQFSHVMLYRIRESESSYQTASPHKILQDVKQFCFSLTMIDSTKDFNDQLIKFIGVENGSPDSSTTSGERSGKTEGDHASG